MVEPVSVHPARGDEAETFWDIQTRSIRALGSSHYTSEQVEAWAGGADPERAHERAMERFSSLIARESVFAAEDAAGLVLGFACLDQTTGEVSALYVDPDCARRGVGTLLMATVEDRARALGLTELHLRGSLNAVAFYERMGFEVKQRIIHRFSSWLEIPCVIMTKQLPGG